VTLVGKGYPRNALPHRSHHEVDVRTSNWPRHPLGPTTTGIRPLGSLVLIMVLHSQNAEKGFGFI
jgi:hypothetical protein